MKAKRFFSGLSIAALAIFAGACQPPSYHQPDERYVLVAANIDLPYWQEAAAGLTDVGKSMGSRWRSSGLRHSLRARNSSRSNKRWRSIPRASWFP